MTFTLPYYLKQGNIIRGNPCCCCVRNKNGVPTYITNNEPYFDPNPFASILLSYETYNLLGNIPGPYQGLWNRTF